MWTKKRVFEEKLYGENVWGSRGESFKKKTVPAATGWYVEAGRQNSSASKLQLNKCISKAGTPAVEHGTLKLWNKLSKMKLVEQRYATKVQQRPECRFPVHAQLFCRNKG